MRQILQTRQRGKVIDAIVVQQQRLQVRQRCLRGQIQIRHRVRRIADVAIFNVEAMIQT